MKIVLNQINPTIGDFEKNCEKILKGIDVAREQQIRIAVFPELAITGYPPEDFLLVSDFIIEAEKCLHKIVKASKEIAVIVGFPRINQSGKEKSLYNSVAIIDNQQILGFQDKILLPTYDVFDERRYFEPGTPSQIWNIGSLRVGVTICEDLWEHSQLVSSTRYHLDPIKNLIELKPDILVNVSASPYSLSKLKTRLNACQQAAQTLQCPVLYCNQVGANDSLIFDGYSMHVNAKGLVQIAKGFEEDRLVIDTSIAHSLIAIPNNTIQDLQQALILGIKDYCEKSGLKKVCIGLSGGIDSAVVACLAVEALGANNVHALFMPSRYSATESGRDALELAQRLKIQFDEISIEAPFESYLNILKPSFKGMKEDITEENLQARVRGTLLMAFCNKFGYLLLNTGNKSELAMGYCTLYGDMCGGLAVIGDLTKLQVYEIAAYINRSDEIIPKNILERPPSAELRPNQKDSDTLPDYVILDTIIKAYVEEFKSPHEIAMQYDYPLSLVDEIIKKIHQNEYKRRQAPPILRVSEKSFSAGRRCPIVQRWL